MTQPIAEPLKADFRKFLFLIWKHLRLPPPTALQLDIAYYLQHGPDRCIIQGFRGVAKSWITAAFAVWWLYCRPHDNVMVVSANKDRANEFTTFCLRLVSEVPFLQHLAPQEGQRSSMSGFDVGPASASQTPSMVSVGIFGMMTGKRGDLILPDDVEIPNNSETATMRAKLRERVREWEAILKPGGKIKLLGTYQVEDSTYVTLEDEAGYEVRVWPSEVPDEEYARTVYGERLAPYVRGLMKDKANVGHSTEPSRFTDIDLAQRRMAYGRTGYERQFRLNPSAGASEEQPLRLADLIVYPLDPRYGPERIIHAALPANIVEETFNVGIRGDRLYTGVLPLGKDTRMLEYQGAVLAIDPAGRGKDETGYAVVAHLSGMFFLLDAGGLQGYEATTRHKLVEIAKKYRVSAVVIEPDMGDGMFLTLIKPDFVRDYPVHLIESERSNSQKEKRIADVLEPITSGHRLVVDQDLFKRDYTSTQSRPPEMQQRYRLWYQYTRLTREKGSLLHDDRLDAVSLAVAYYQRMAALDHEQESKSRRERDLDEALRFFHGMDARKTDNVAPSDHHEDPVERPRESWGEMIGDTVWTGRKKEGQYEG